MNPISDGPVGPLFEVIWPSGKSVSRLVDLAPGVRDLNGKTICEVWDWVFRGDQMYSVINEELRTGAS